MTLREAIIEKLRELALIVGDSYNSDMVDYIQQEVSALSNDPSEADSIIETNVYHYINIVAQGGAG